MKGLKKIIIVILGLVLLIAVANLALNYWIEKKLPALINTDDSPFYIEYEDIDVSLFNSSILATEVVVVPKDTKIKTDKKSGLYAHVKQIRISNFKLWDILFTNKIRARHLHVVRPNVLIYKTPDEIVKPKNAGFFSKIVVVSEATVEGGNLKTFDLSDDPTLSISNINLEIDGILVTDDILERKIPFDFDTYKVKFDSVYYKSGKYYVVTAQNFSSNKHSLTVKNVAYSPTYSRDAFIKAIPVEKDLFAVKVGTVSISNMDWGFKKNNFFFHSGSVILESMFANIFRSKLPPDDPKTKPLYSRVLRKIPFDLKIDTLAIKNSKLEYEEEKTFERGAGMLTFNKFNLYARHVNSGFGRKIVPDVRIKVRCLFMGASPMDVNWRMNPLDRTDRFNISGSVHNFPAENLTPFTKPYMNVTAKGTLEELKFNISGNDDVAHGNVALNYDDLKVTIFRKKEEKKKNKILSAIANLFVKNDSNERPKDAEIEVERTKAKSFFNYFWRCIAEGLKKILV